MQNRLIQKQLWKAKYIKISKYFLDEASEITINNAAQRYLRFIGL